MGSFGELVLVLGDLHIPERATVIPENFKRMLVPNKMQHIICTGNISREEYNQLCTLAPNVVVSAGDYDNIDQQQQQDRFPEHRVIQVGNFRIGVIHGHQIIPYNSHDAKARVRRKLNVDILVTGHSHKNEVVLQDDCYHINPGSITGAYSPLTPNATPSFILLAIQESKLVCYVYELVNGEVEVSKTEFTKATTTTTDATTPALMQSLLS